MKEHPAICSLTWNGREGVIGDILKQLCLQHDFSDVTIVSDDELCLPAHSLVLSACSPFLASFLKSESTITFASTKSSHIQNLLTLLYCGEVLITKNSLGPLKTLASQLQISCHFQDDCPKEVAVVPSNNGASTHITASPRMDFLQAKLTELISTSLRKEVEDNQTYWHCLCCGKRWRVTRQNARRHMETHLPRQKCETCGDTFTYRDVLIRHMKKEHVNNDLTIPKSPCDVDETILNANSKTFNVNSYFDQIDFLISFKMVNMETRDGEHSWLCLICGESWKLKSKCKSHMQVHLEGEKGNLLRHNSEHGEAGELEVDIQKWEEKLKAFENALRDANITI